MTMAGLFRQTAALVLGLALTLPAGSQVPAERRLAPVTGQLSEEFVSITSIRELRDGRVLITDPRGGRLVLADFGADRLDTIGRRGRGPGEYDLVWPIWPLSEDSTLMPLPASRRWILFDGARMVSTLSPDAHIVREGLFLHGADRLGRVLMQRSDRAKPGITEIGAGDSSYLLLGDRRTGRVDTVGRVRRAEMRVEAESDADGRIIRSSARAASPLAADEPARLFLDGWIAVVRRAPYRVDWRTPTGEWRKGPPLPFTPVRIDQKEREAAMRFSAEQSGSEPRSPDSFAGWPSELPPYTEYRTYPIVPAPQGHIAIRRTRSARAPEPRYDIVNREGRLVSRIVLEPGEAIVGFGRQSVYVVRIDDDGLLWLTRHPWP